MGIVFGKLVKGLEKEIFPRVVKRKITENNQNPLKKSRRLDPIHCDNESPSTSGDTKTRNTPEEALSKRSANRNAVADDGPVETKKRTLDMFQARYEEQEKLGEGGFGCVFAGHRKADNLNVAIKHIRQEDVFKHRDNTGKQIPMEVAVMLKLAGETERPSAPIDLLDWYDLDQELILVLERPMPAVDLHDYIKAKGGYLMEKDAKVILRQVVDAAIDLQQRHIFHRDIKVNNLLIETSNKKAPRVRIIDFGVSCFSAEGDAFRNFEGTHFPPEWHSQHEYKAGPTTVYQIGGVLYDMLHQQSFGQENLYQQRRINWRFSENCRDFFKSCFQTDPDRRLTLQQLRNHLWLR
ncbi:serine/threonine-protein kinase pim-2-like isoform X2 [Clinocottus analis]|uniref:serine/threonine-protein kinase pim-2-like isoform X2 n=1 Tax=Clinocottus analis TaxID=304258 RepID=UPI0035C09324